MSGELVAAVTSGFVAMAFVIRELARSLTEHRNKRPNGSKTIPPTVSAHVGQTSADLNKERQVAIIEKLKENDRANAERHDRLRELIAGKLDDLADQVRDLVVELRQMNKN